MWSEGARSTETAVYRLKPEVKFYPCYIVENNRENRNFRNFGARNALIYAPDGSIWEKE